LIPCNGYPSPLSQEAIGGKIPMSYRPKGKYTIIHYYYYYYYYYYFLKKKNLKNLFIKKILDPQLASCICNQEYYNQLTDCISCYNTPKSNITVAPLDEYKKDCGDLGVDFSTTP